MNLKTPNRLPALLSLLSVLALSAACSGYGYGSTNPPNPATNPANGATVIPWYVGATNVQTTVKAGALVQWSSEDAMVHTVTSSSTPAAFPEIRVPSDGYSEAMRFDNPGTYPYFCSIHGARVQSGTLTVTP